jgi:hypothetical protein
MSRTLHWSINRRLASAFAAFLISAAAAHCASAHTGDLVDTNDLSAKGNDVANDTDALRKAINSGAARIVLPAGTYKITGTLTLAANQCIEGIGPGQVTIRWAGGNDTDIINTPISGAPTFIRPCLREITVDAGSATGVNLLHLRDTQQGNFEDLRLLGEGGNGNVCLDLTAGAGGSGSNHNTAANRFNNIRGDYCPKGVRFAGRRDGTAFVTDNWFDFIWIYNLGGPNPVGTCFDFVRWSDTNNFSAAQCSLGASGSTGVVFNSGSPTREVGVYDNNFFYLSVDAFGHVNRQIGIEVNNAKQLRILNYYTSPDDWARIGKKIDTTHAVQSYNSYEIDLSNNYFPTYEMRSFSKNDSLGNVIADSIMASKENKNLALGTASGVGMYILNPGIPVTNTVRVTAAAAGRAPLIQCAGQADVDCRIEAHGTGTVTFGSHVKSVGAAPTVSACGIASVFPGSTDTRGVIRITGRSPSRCTLRFAASYRSSPFGFPVCTTTTNNIGIVLSVNALTATTITWLANAALPNGSQIYYQCWG